ncbi:hypothetical protein KC19_N020200 [Ceratodon purpureus]|nr:hypothetical protein KC19_N020200 [Ceratodon purpureus]
MSGVQPEWEWRLQVTLLDASNLETVHFRNLLGNWIQVNPLCSLVFNGRCVAESKPCMGGGTNPAWREVLETRQHDGVVSLPDATIFAVILHFDTKSKYRHIGTAIIPLADFVEDAWNDKTYQVATIKVRLQKQKAPKLIAAAANSTTVVPPSPSTSSTSSDLIQIFIASLALGMDLGGRFFGVR